MQKWYIYYDSSGKIYSVTNEKKLKGNYIESSEHDVQDFISGKKKFDNFTVKYTENKLNYLQENYSLDRLKFFNLERLTEEKIKQIDFNKNYVYLYEHIPNYVNFLKEKFLIENEDSLKKFLNRSVLIKVIKNDENDKIC